MRIEVIYALRLEQSCVEVELPAGASVAQAVAQSGMLERVPRVEREGLVMAVWGRVVDPAFVLEEGDRVELLRPLIADPKEVRRARAAGRGRAVRKPA